MKKNIICIIPAEGIESWFFKDPGMMIYGLSKYCGYNGTLAYLGKEYHNNDFEKYCKVLSMGNFDKQTKRDCLNKVKLFIKDNIKQYDAVLLFNYGNTNYKFAYLCKKYNPNIKVWCKLDMSDSGYSHFYEDSYSRKIKNYIEKIKSKYVDLFTVETLKYYNDLKDTKMFAGGRLKYLPNGVSLLGVDIEKLDNIPKENIVLTVGRLGSYEKNNEMLLEAISMISKSAIKDWKFYFVGPIIDSFSELIEIFFVQHAELKDKIVFMGNISDRQKLYEIYAKSKFFCMTSRSESFCIATIEAMYFGCIPLLTRYGAVVDDQTDCGRIGNVCEESSASDFAAKLENAIMSDNSDKSSQKAREWARSRFNYENIVKKIDVLLK